MHTNRNTNSTNLADRSSRRARIVGRVAAVAVVAGAAFGVASSGPFDAEASAECTPQTPPALCTPIDIDDIPVPQGPVVLAPGKLPGPVLPPKDTGIPDGAEKHPVLPGDDQTDLSPVEDLPDLSVDVAGPADAGDSDVPGPGEVAPENTNQAGGEDCANITACPEVTVPPETTTTTTTTTVPVDVEGETEVPVGELAFTGSGDTLLRLGVVLAIGGVAAVSSAAAARKRRD